MPKTTGPLIIDPGTNLPAIAERPALPEPQAGELVSMIERLASNRDVDVAKLEKIIELKERVMAHDAKSAFDAAYSRMQPEIPAIDEKGRITNKDGSVRSKFAKLEDIQRAVKPILARYGFALRHRTEWPEDRKGVIRVVGILAHEYGHAEESVFEAPMDRSEYRTDIQSQGSTVSYGRRYTTIDLLNIETRGVDNDGQGADKPKAVAPNGYEKFWTALEDVAPEGIARLTQVFEAGAKPFRDYVLKNCAREWAALKNRAQKGGGA